MSTAYDVWNKNGSEGRETGTAPLNRGQIEDGLAGADTNGEKLSGRSALSRWEEKAQIKCGEEMSGGELKMM